MSAIVLENVEKWFGSVQVIKGVSLTIEDGELVVFVGPSGCGKSTLLRIIAGLEDASRGTVHVGGKDVTGASPAARGLAMVFQSYALYPHMDVRANMGFGLKASGAPAEEIAEKVAAAADILKLNDYLDRRPKDLSGGQRQRVAIGRSIVRDPTGFLFDEPLSNLDAALRVDMRIEIARLHKRLAASMVYVTHDQVEAMTLADRIVVLKDGVIEQIGTPRELYEHPTNLFVAQFIGSPKMNVLACETDGTTAAPRGHKGKRIALPRAGVAPTTIGVRPEFIDIVAAGEGHLDGVVDIVEYLGADALVHVAGQSDVPITVRQPGDCDVQSGDRVSLLFKQNKTTFFDAAGIAV